MKHQTNSWDSTFLFYVPKIIATLIFVTITFVPDSWTTPNSWTTPMVVVGFVALALAAVLDILRYRHRVANEVEEENECDEEYQVQQMGETCEEQGVKPNCDTQEEPESRWAKIEKWGEVVDKYNDAVYWIWLVVVAICVLCATWIVPLLK